MAPPIFEITPTHVLSFGIKVSEADASQWLKLWAHTFSLRMKDIVSPELSKLFQSATPSRTFDRFVKKVEKAIHRAENEYAENIGLCYSRDCMTERECCRMVAYLMGAGSGKREAICYQEITMTPPNSSKEGPETREEHPVHVIAEAGKVRARVLAGYEQLQKKILVFGAPDKKSQPAHSKIPPMTTMATVH
ncbi:MAG TPA: hypothetical protein VJV96_08390 [Candidatus Angelobacter sp.]|jgi:hypothetical protein|nr:hypothetical protein [Candidatus Angelobacter sp.]